jgi:ABC-type multidrug transport system permease subunit
VIRAVIAKDVALLLRDRGALISLFALPLVFILVFGSIFHSGPDRDQARPVAIWFTPQDGRGAAIAGALAVAPGFSARTVGSAEEVRRLVVTDAVVAGLVIPPEPDAAIELVIDLAAPLQVRGPLEGALTAVVMRALLPASLRIESRSPPGRGPPIAQASAFQIAVPANAVLFGFFLALTVATSLASDRRSGAWRRLLAAPVSRGTALVASLVPYVLIGIVQLAFLFGAGALVFGMEIAGSVSALIAVSVAMVYCAVSLGLLFAAIGGSERQLAAFGSVVLLVMGILGGCMLPRLLMPPEMQTIGLAVPHGWALDGYYDVLVRTGTGMTDVLPAVGALVGFGTIFAMFGVAWFRFEE